jgi:hypothetical protein
VPFAQLGTSEIVLQLAPFSNCRAGTADCDRGDDDSEDAAPAAASSYGVASVVLRVSKAGNKSLSTMKIPGVKRGLEFDIQKDANAM